MASKNVRAQGAKLTVGGVTVGGIKSWGGLGGGSSAIIDETDLDSTAMEKSAGLADEGQLSLTLNLQPTDAGQKALIAARKAQATVEFVLTLKDGTKYTFDGIVLSFGRDGAVNALITVDCTIEITGDVVETPAA